MKNIYLKTAEALREIYNLTNRKGITLIALVLTIIILLLLAGISISMIAGQDGILTKATTAKKEMNKSELEEKIGLAVAEWELEKGSNSNYNVTLEEHLKTKIDIKSEEPLTWVSGDNVVNIDSNNNLTVNSKSKNLFKNGYLENKNNDNFTVFNYHKDGYLYMELSKIAAGKIYVSDEFIPIDTSKKYELSAIIKGENIKNNRIYGGITEYDIDFKIISPHNYTYTANTLTYLTKDLKDGDTEIHLNDISNFIYDTNTKTYQMGLIFWNYKDSTGYKYEPLTYSRNVWGNLFEYSESNPAIDKENNIIKLKEPWKNGIISKGTYLSQKSDGGVYNYLFDHVKINEEWKTFKKEIEGEVKTGNNSYTGNFRPGTKYIKFAYHTYDKADTTIYIKDIVLKEVE